MDSYTYGLKYNNKEQKDKHKTPFISQERGWVRSMSL